jgi:hypothetical protein
MTDVENIIIKITKDNIVLREYIKNLNNRCLDDCDCWTYQMHVDKEEKLRPIYTDDIEVHQAFQKHMDKLIRLKPHFQSEYKTYEQRKMKVIRDNEVSILLGIIQHLEEDRDHDKAKVVEKSLELNNTVKKLEDIQKKG